MTTDEIINDNIEGIRTYVETKVRPIGLTDTDYSYRVIDSEIVTEAHSKDLIELTMKVLGVYCNEYLEVSNKTTIYEIKYDMYQHILEVNEVVHNAYIYEPTW